MSPAFEDGIPDKLSLVAVRDIQPWEAELVLGVSVQGPQPKVTMLVPAPTVAMEASGSATPEVSGSPPPRALSLPATPESFGLAGISNAQYAHFSDPELLSIVDLAKKHRHFAEFHAEQAAEYIDGEPPGFGDVAGDPLADLESWDSWMAETFKADHVEWVEMLRDSSNAWCFDMFCQFRPFFRF